MSAEDSSIFHKLTKAAAKQAVRQGAAKADISEDMSKFLASQLAFTYDLVKKGAKVTPRHLAALLFDKGLGIADLVLGRRFDCAIAALILGSSLVKSFALTTFEGPAVFVIDAAQLLAECYSMDKTCGISDAVSEEIQKASLPAYIWMERGVVEWMSRGGS